MIFVLPNLFFFANQSTNLLNPFSVMVASRAHQKKTYSAVFDIGPVSHSAHPAFVANDRFGCKRIGQRGGELRSSSLVLIFQNAFQEANFSIVVDQCLRKSVVRKSLP